MEGRFEELFIQKDSGATESPSHLFVDTAVYSRNRCFRLALSSKAGKTSVLLPTGRYVSANVVCEEDMFMASLICNVDVDCEKLLICKMDLDCIKTLRFELEEKINFGQLCSFANEVSLSGCMSDVSTSCMGKSPFPALDKFVESVASTGSVLGKIRCWYWFSECGLIVYNMSKSRYCERIGREHKSNHVMYVVDLRRAAYYQKCHDPDCKGYRSPLRPIPIHSIPSQYVSSDSKQILDDIGYTDDPINSQSLSDNQECLLLISDESITDGSIRDSWWLEAIRVAETVENMQKMESGKSDLEDDDWWIAVENSYKE